MPCSPLMLAVSKPCSGGVFVGRLRFQNGHRLNHLLHCLTLRASEIFGNGNVLPRVTWRGFVCWRFDCIHANTHDSGRFIATRSLDQGNKRVPRMRIDSSRQALEPVCALKESQLRHFSRYAEQKYSDDEYLAEDNPASPSYANVNDWRWKFN
eukprot:c5359_g1_i1 orf=150-608(+)